MPSTQKRRLQQTQLLPPAMLKEHTASNVANANRQTINYFQSCKCRYSKRVLSEAGIAIGHGRPIDSYQYKCGHLPNNNSDFSSSIQYEKKKFYEGKQESFDHTWNSESYTAMNSK